MTSSPEWELQGQILILSNCALQELCNDKIKLEQEEQKHEDVRLIDMTYTNREAEELIPQFLEMIDKVFTIHSPKAT